MPKTKREPAVGSRIQTGYVLDASCVRRLRIHAATIGKSARDVLEGLIKKHLPKYEPDPK